MAIARRRRFTAKAHNFTALRTYVGADMITVNVHGCLLVVSREVRRFLTSCLVLLANIQVVHMT